MLTLPGHRMSRCRGNCRVKRDEVCILHCNISMWGRPVVDYVISHSRDTDLFLFCEHHLHDHEALRRAQVSMKRARVHTHFHPAAPSDIISQFEPGSRSWRSSCHGGVAMMWNAGLNFSPTPDDVMLTFFHRLRTSPGLLQGPFSSNSHWC